MALGTFWKYLPHGSQSLHAQSQNLWLLGAELLGVFENVPKTIQAAWTGLPRQFIAALVFGFSLMLPIS